MTLPLEPYTVIDLTRARSGPTCVRQLAEMGANVIKVENRSEDDFARDGFDFQNLHRNKRSITLDLKNPRGVEVLKRLVAKADVLVENYRPDVKHRLGIDYETLSKVNPRLVYGSISGFGQSGPYRDRPGYDQIAQGMGGLMSITGLPGQGPVRVGIPVADLTAGLFCALKLAPHPVTILTAAPMGEGASSAWAQGGIAWVQAEGDTVEQHIEDTLVAGAGLCVEEAVRVLVRERARRGMRFGVAAMAVVGSARPLVSLVLEGDEGAGRRAVDDRKPSVDHRRDDTGRSVQTGWRPSCAHHRPARARHDVDPSLR